MTRVWLAVGVALLLLGLIGIARHLFRNSPRQKKLRRAEEAYADGLRFARTHELAAAETAARDALALWTELGDAPSLAKPAAELGRLLTEAGAHRAAITQLTAAEAVLAELARVDSARYRPRLAALYTVRASAEAELGEHAEALRYDGLALPVWRRLAADDPITYELPLYTSLAAEARHFAAIGRVSEALSSAHEALAGLRAVVDSDGHGRTNRQRRARTAIGRVLAEQAGYLLLADRDEQALQTAEEAERATLADGDRDGHGQALATKAECLLRLGRRADAEAPAREALRIARVRVHGRAEVARAAVLVAGALGGGDEAYLLATEAVEIYEGLGGRYATEHEIARDLLKSL